ncbi:MAG: hypothetical protein WBM50_11115, partial [Acidimicrobiales bacterium]
MIRECVEELDRLIDPTPEVTRATRAIRRDRAEQLDEVGSCDAHHATHGLDHGTTDPDNLVLLCWFHHHLLHEQHW